MSLKETLAELDEMVPVVPGQALELRARGTTFMRQVESSLEGFAKLRGEAAELTETVRQALSALGDQAKAQRESVDEVIVQAETVVSDAVAGIGERADGLESSIAQAGGAMEALAGALQSAAASALSAEETAVSAVAALSEAAAAESSELRGAVDAAVTEAGSLALAVGDVQRQVGARAEATEACLAELLKQGRERIAALLETLDDLRAGHEAALEDEQAHLESRRDALAEQVEARLEDDVTQPVGAAVEAVSEALEALGGVLQAAGGRVAGARETVDAALKAVGEAAAPLPRGVEQVKVAAARVGLDFA